MIGVAAIPNTGNKRFTLQYTWEVYQLCFIVLGFEVVVDPIRVGGQDDALILFVALVKGFDKIE